VKARTSKIQRDPSKVELSGFH